MGKRIGKQTLFWKDVWTKLNTPLLEVLVVISTQFGSKFKEQKFWRMKISAFNILCKFFIYEYAKGSQSAGLVVFQLGHCDRLIYKGGIRPWEVVRAKEIDEMNGPISMRNLRI
ncbi:hypothetical protein K1719_044709 [Acacia pycnantha]|nr:hypothetical protein K1719_044709 [Acacia pycnantha]